MGFRPSLAKFIAISIVIAALLHPSAVLSEGIPGVSPGSPGMPDEESYYLSDLHQAKRERKNLSGALISLGLHYNRKEQYAKACKALDQALSATGKTDYESLGQLLPPLIDAEIQIKRLSSAEIHAKQLIELARSNRIPQFPNLMFACNQYSRVLTSMHRPAEAARFKKEADQINSNIKGL